LSPKATAGGLGAIMATAAIGPRIRRLSDRNERGTGTLIRGVGQYEPGKLQEVRKLVESPKISFRAPKHLLERIEQMRGAFSVSQFLRHMIEFYPNAVKAFRILRERYPQVYAEIKELMRNGA